MTDREEAKPRHRWNSTIRMTDGSRDSADQLRLDRAAGRISDEEFYRRWEAMEQRKRKQRTRLKRSPIKKRRTVKRFAHLRDEKYQAWIRRRPCLLRQTGECLGDVQACHVRAKGPGNPDRQNLWPGCAKHHDESHRGQKTFAKKYGLDLKATALRLDEAYDEEDLAF